MEKIRIDQPDLYDCAAYLSEHQQICHQCGINQTMQLLVDPYSSKTLTCDITSITDACRYFSQLECKCKLTKVFKYQSLELDKLTKVELDNNRKLLMGAVEYQIYLLRMSLNQVAAGLVPKLVESKANSTKDNTSQDTNLEDEILVTVKHLLSDQPKEDKVKPILPVDDVLSLHRSKEGKPGPPTDQTKEELFKGKNYLAPISNPVPFPNPVPKLHLPSIEDAIGDQKKENNGIPKLHLTSVEDGLTSPSVSLSSPA